MNTTATAAPTPTPAPHLNYGFAILDRQEDRAPMYAGNVVGDPAGYRSLDQALDSLGILTRGDAPAAVVWKDTGDHRFHAATAMYLAPGSPMTRGTTGSYHLGMLTGTPREPRTPRTVTDPRRFPDGLEFRDANASAIVDGNWILANPLLKP